MSKRSEETEKIIALLIVVFAFISVPIMLYLFISLVLLEIRYVSRYLLYTNTVDLFYSIGLLVSLVVVGYLLLRLVKWVRD
jgi:hypothetical protein